MGITIICGENKEYAKIFDLKYFSSYSSAPPSLASASAYGRHFSMFSPPYF